MKFKIDKYKYDLVQKDFLSNALGVFLKFIFLVIALPLILIQWLSRIINPIRHSSKWEPFINFGELQIERIFIQQNELPINLDFPDEPNDVNVFKLKSSPEIKDLDSFYFDNNSAETESGLYLISINKKELGMTLLCLNKQNFKLFKVLDLDNLLWSLAEESENEIRLRGKNNDNGFDFLVKEIKDS